MEIERESCSCEEALGNCNEMDCHPPPINQTHFEVETNLGIGSDVGEGFRIVSCRKDIPRMLPLRSPSQKLPSELDKTINLSGGAVRGHKDVEEAIKKGTSCRLDLPIMFSVPRKSLLIICDG